MENTMSSGSRVTTAYAVQTDIDTVPASGWKTLPNISNGLNNTTTLTDSEMLNGTRIKSSGMVTSGEITGDISSELMYGTFDDLIEAAFWNDWSVATGDAEITIGDERKFFAVTKDFNDIKAHYVFKGVHVNTMSIDVATDAIVKIDFGLMGLGYDADKVKSFAITPEPAVMGGKASAMTIGDIKADGSLIGVCVEAFNFELDNQSEIQKCLGDNMYGGNMHAMIANATGSMTLAFSPEAYDLLELQRTGAIMSLEFPIKFPDGSGYTITLPKLQINGDIPSPSGSDIVTAEVSFTVVDESPIIKRIAA